MSKLDKLNKLQEWFTLEDAAKHISKKIDETITVADLYRLALDRHLKVSVYFVNNAYGITAKLCGSGDIDNQLLQGFDTERSVVQRIEGIWDLTMRGREAHLIKEHFVESSSGLKFTQQSKYESGILLQRDGVICRLYKPFDRKRIYDPKFNESEERQLAIAEEPMRALENSPMVIEPMLRTGRFGIEYLPCNKFSDVGCVLIIKSSEVTRFIQFLEDTPQEEKPLTSNERNSLLVLIAALCKADNIDWNQRGIANYLVEITSLLGAPLSNDTIRKIVKQIDPAITSRSK